MEQEYEHTWHFEIAAAAHYAEDEDGTPCKAYCHLTLSYKRETMPEYLAAMEPTVIAFIADQLHIAPEHIRPISKAEYDEHMSDDEEGAA